MNGLTKAELTRLNSIRSMVKVDLETAQRVASRWALANKERRVIREMALSTVRRLRSSYPWNDANTWLVIDSENKHTR